MTTTEFLDAVKVKRGLASDYKLAKFLGVSQQTISSYRTGRSMMDEAMCLKIAAALELEPGEVLVAIAIEREKRVEVKTAWQRVAKRLAAGVGVALLYITLSAGQSPAYAQDATKLYICDKRWKQAALRLSRWLWTLGLALALAAPAAAADWSGADTAPQAASRARRGADWGQPLHRPASGEHGRNEPPPRAPSERCRSEPLFRARAHRSQRDRSGVAAAVSRGLAVRLDR